MAEPTTQGFQRLDRWLWCARLVKSRTLAAKLCAAGHVTLGDTPVRKAHQPLRIGDRLLLRHGRWERRLEVLALAERRGPATEARTLYTETAPPRAVETKNEPWESLFEEDASPLSPRGGGLG